MYNNKIYHLKSVEYNYHYKRTVFKNQSKSNIKLTVVINKISTANLNSFGYAQIFV